MRVRRLLPALLGLALFGGCTSLVTDRLTEPATPPEIRLAGLDSPVKLRRDSLGIPLIEADNDSALGFGLGYVAAQDRISQMVGFRLIAQGRLAEMAGAPVLDIDRYMRTMNLRRAAQVYWDGASPQARALLQRYADGVNAWLARGYLPPDLRISGYQPEPWTPLDSLTVFALINFGLAQNLHEEIDFLLLAQRLGPEKAAWLMPVYPDQPLPFDEANKLAGIDLGAMAPSLKQILAVQADASALLAKGFAASNNWAIHPSRTANGATILANDTHLPLSMPSMWHVVHFRSPDMDVAGVAAAGLPGVVAGYNGRVAWGMTMVMADNEDVFLEKLKTIDGVPHYLYQDKWLPCVARQERYAVKGSQPVFETIWETRHGPLLNPVLNKPPLHSLLPRQIDLPYGIAVQSAAFEADSTLDAFLGLNRARSVAEALPLARQIRAIALNLVLGDHDNIAWQVTGRYPLRKRGTGQLPSPGWTGDYDWTGYLDPLRHPASQNPPEGFIASANQRSVPPGDPRNLSQSWYYPERYDMLTRSLQASNRQTGAMSQALQLNQHSLFADKFRNWLNRHPSELAAAISRLPDQDKRRADYVLPLLTHFNGDLYATSSDAAVYGAFLHCVALRTFGDELGAPDSEAWKALISANDASYGAIDDHLLQREDESPFWDDIRTPQKETKADIIVASMADAMKLLRDRLGPDQSKWTWGALHTYYWETEGSKMRDHLGRLEKLGVGLLSSFLDRGPYPAGGDHTTLNAAAYHMGDNFDAWLTPAMRIVVDFSRAEPLLAVNAGGQSSNPGSEHYADGIETWLNGQYQTLPFQRDNIDKAYGPAVWLLPVR